MKKTRINHLQSEFCERSEQNEDWREINDSQLNRKTASNYFLIPFLYLKVVPTEYNADKAQCWPGTILTEYNTNRAHCWQSAMLTERNAGSVSICIISFLAHPLATRAWAQITLPFPFAAVTLPFPFAAVTLPFPFCTDYLADFVNTVADLPAHLLSSAAAVVVSCAAARARAAHI
ncbi:hypothetical protein MmiAt1_01240 [Methanimicrococcus sp. At1]|uniref:Uncharacterized protein n=1 Tax=Methanimicrococcus hacksteinii TaxID=3028293 RepID=A0ABU3VMK3_9EURY|nr:hypothetical protein [Methanimicrococcus sp. At1]MDV0444596.1 hypothetical protein [Methanimicrococcus sp. At1]